MQSISASVAFAGFVRWEFQTREEALSSADQYARIGAESFIVWHEGFDADRQPKIRIEPIGGHLDALLEAPVMRVDARGRGTRDIREDPWQQVFDALRMSRYFFQYPAETRRERHPSLPDRRGFQNLAERPEAQWWRSQDWIRFDLALLDIVVTARFVPEAVSYVSALSENLPPVFLERSNIFAALRERLTLSLPFLGGLVYRQRNVPELRLRLLTRGEESLSRGGFKSIVPWTPSFGIG